MSGIGTGARPPLRDVIARHGFAARHSLGQHFLLDPSIAQAIARLPGPLDGRHVLEVGPGPGGLTRALLDTDARSVRAIEIDPRGVAAIGELAADDPRLEVVAGDARRLAGGASLPAPRQVVANLPYNVATPLLLLWLREAALWQRLTLMFQAEVAERICAAPGSPAYGRLSVLAQWTCEASIAMRLPPAAFVPPPKVASAVVVLTPRPSQPDPALFAAMERLTAQAFGQRRKMLRGSVGDVPRLVAAGIDPTRRGETLTVAEFSTLAATPPPGTG